MNKINIRNSAILALGTICLLTISLTSCGKKADLYMPEEKAKVTSTTDKEKQKKKDQTTVQE
ncbi:LPS translocon maturation chaperone LptM [Kaarinaea lacus]